MLQTTKVKPRATTTERPALTAAPDMSRVCAFTEADAPEVLRFLAVRPVQTVVMSSFIADNGIISELNRGTFHGYRNAAGELEGVALIGHSTLVEAWTDEALKALAFQARTAATPIHLIMSSGDDAAAFHSYFSGGSLPRLACVEALFEAAFPFAIQECEWNIGLADMSQLEQVAEAQAEVAFVECGVDPMVRDRQGFMERVARRIGQGRVFTVFENGELVFKADIIAETRETIYLEGIYVAPSHRGHGVASQCLAALTRTLLGRTEHICLLSNLAFAQAHRTFERAGYRRTDECVTLFL
jgi:uncharacterized protein